MINKDALSYYELVADNMLRKITIYLINYKCKSFINYNVNIQTFDNKKIADKKSIYGVCSVYLQEKNFYKLIFTTKFGNFSKIIYINKTASKIFVYINDNYNKLLTTFYLVDKNYRNLPIQKGVIYLWRNHIM